MTNAANELVVNHRIGSSNVGMSPTLSMFTRIHECKLDYLNVYWIIWMFTGLFGCLLDYLDVGWITWTLIGLHKC